MKQKQYMTTLRQAAWTLAACTLLAACHTDDTAKDLPTADDHPILLSALSIGEATTRTGIADTYNSWLTEGSSVGVYIYDNDGAYLTGKVGGTEGQVATWVYKTGAPYAIGGGLYRSGLSLTSHDKTPAYPQTNNVYKDHVTIYAIFPNNSSYTPPSSSSTATSYTVEAPLNQTDDYEAQIKAADLLTTDGKITFTREQCIGNGEMVNLQLKHQMAKLTVTFTPASGSDLTAANMPTKFDVIGVCRSLTVTPSAGTIATVSANATTEANPLKGCTTQSILIPPQTLTAGQTLLKFNILGSGHFRGMEGALFKVPTGGVTLQAGYEYRVNVTVDVDFISMKGTITAWTDGGEIKYENYRDSVM